MKCDRCGATVDGTGFLGGEIICQDCKEKSKHYQEAVENGSEIF